MHSPSPIRPRRLRSRPGVRRGAAAVEFAVCLPVLVVIVLASIEACSMIFLKQALQTAAYETVRVAIHANGSMDAAIARAHEMLDQRRVQGGAVNVSPANLKQLATGTPVTVRVRAPIAPNRVVSPWFFSSGQLSASCVMAKEGNSF